MSLRLSRAAALATLTVAASASLVPNDARACGGCFHPENQPETTVVTGHRMVLSISPKQTVLWDQVEYAGSPSEFAWVLPVRQGAYVEVGNDAWFETLDAATSTRVTAPALTCNNFGQDGMGFDGDGMGFDDEGGGSSGCDAPMFSCFGGASSDSAGGSDEAAFGSAAGTSGSTGGGVEPEEPPPVSVVHSGSVGPYETVTLHANEQG